MNAAGGWLGGVRFARGHRAESGIRTFRDANGLCEQHDIQEVASPSGWAKNPSLVWRFYSQRRLQTFEVQPNAAHVALAHLERAWANVCFCALKTSTPCSNARVRLGSCTCTGELLKSRCERDHAAPFYDDAAYVDAKTLAAV